MEQNFDINQSVYELTHQILAQQNFGYSQIKSFDNFIKSEYGLKRTISQLFRIQRAVVIEPTQTKVNGQTFTAMSLEVEVAFSNVKIEPQTITQEEINQFVGLKDEAKKQTIFTKDISLPNIMRTTGKTYKVDVFSDITVKLRAFDDKEAQGNVIDSRSQTLQQKRIMQIPLMVGSKNCILYKKTPQELIRFEEDPTDEGGYFIIKGNEWVVSATESIKFNEISIRDWPKKKMASGTILSKAGDTFEGSTQTKIQYYRKTGKITITMGTTDNFEDVEIPFFIIFKIFDVVNEREMVGMITQDEANSDNPTTRALQEFVLKAMSNEYADFPGAKDLKGKEAILQCLTAALNSEAVKRKHPDTLFDFTMKSAQDKLITYLLPHMGTTTLHSNVKMRYLGSIIRKLLISVKDNNFPDQNTFLYKRVHSTGQNMAKTVKKQFNYQVVRKLSMTLVKQLQQTCNIQLVNPAEIVQGILAKNYEMKSLQKTIITGSGSENQQPRGKPTKNRIHAEKLERKNIVNLKSSIRLINNNCQSLDKQSKNIIQQRSIQPSFYGFICLVQASETGSKAGKVKSTSSLTVITSALFSTDIIDVIISQVPDKLYGIQQFASSEEQANGLQRVYVNGFWIGFVHRSDLYEVAKILRQFRRENPKKWKYVTVYINEDQELYVYSDYGRLVTPLLIVHYDAHGNPFLKVDSAIQKKLRTGNMTVAQMLEMQIIEYLSIEEMHNCLVAESPDQFFQKLNQRKEMDPTLHYNYTHVLIPYSLFGIVGLICPFANRTQTQRITMFTNQARQACGWAMFNYPFRVDRSTLIMQYISQPLVRTIMNDFVPPNGQQIIVAYTCYDGSNQEDSVIINKGSLDRGLFRCAYYTYEDVQMRFNEIIEDGISGNQPQNKYGNHDKLLNGIIQKGVWVQKQDVLIAKHEQHKSGAQNTSLVYRKDEFAFVEDVQEFLDESLFRVIRIKLKTIRNLKQGDKMSSRAGCKAIVSRVENVANMPCTADGIVPDMIFNSHSVPTRMITGQMMESLVCKLQAQKMEHFDGTVFCNVDLDDIYDQLEKRGIYDKGYSTMYNGDTSDRMKSDIFLCPVFYQRLQKFSVQGQYVVSDGPKHNVTRQYIRGRQSDGGMRVGEMESDCLYSHGAMSIFQEKLYDHSDGYNGIYCKNCGYKARYNPTRSVYACDICHENVDIVQLPSCWASNIFIHSVNAMNVDMKMEFVPPSLEIR